MKPDPLLAVGQGSDRIHIRAGDVESLHWETGASYANLVITMKSGAQHKVREWQGSAYDAERAILAANAT